jgi:hypothetical protein
MACYLKISISVGDVYVSSVGRCNVLLPLGVRLLLLDMLFASMKRAVLYLRVSTVDQTTVNQERELREVASANCEVLAR